MTTHPLSTFISGLFGGPIVLAIAAARERRKIKEKSWWIYLIALLVIPLLVMVLVRNYLLVDVVYINFDLEDLVRFLPTAGLAYLFVNLPFAALAALLQVPLSRVYDLDFYPNLQLLVWGFVVGVVSLIVISLTILRPQVMLQNGQELDPRCFDKPECCQGGKFSC